MHRNQVCISLQVGQWHTVVITQLVSLYSCDLFHFILLTPMLYKDHPSHFNQKAGELTLNEKTKPVNYHGCATKKVFQM